MKIKRICKQCGKEFEVIPAIIKRGGGKYCSRKCRGNPKIKQICKQCYKVFEVYPYRIKHGGGKFCSRKCYIKSLKTQVKRICMHCGKIFEVRPCEIKQGNGKFCSRKCMGKWKSKNLIGKNATNWQGGLSFEPYCLKFNEEFKEYIRNKFGRVCFLCPKTEAENGRKLDVHHVNYNKNCGCDNDETCQFVPLCRSCNGKVNKNRKEWEAEIKAKMQNKLNGWYI